MRSTAVRLLEAMGRAHASDPILTLAFQRTAARLAASGRVCQTPGASRAAVTPGPGGHIFDASDQRDERDGNPSTLPVAGSAGPLPSLLPAVRPTLQLPEIEVSRHVFRRAAFHAAELHARMVALLAADEPAWAAHRLQVRRGPGLRRWMVVER